MAHVFSTSASRLTVGSQTAAGITNPQKLPYEASVFGGLSILNGPVQIGVAPLTPVPKGVLDIGPSVPTSGPIALSAVHIIHPVKGIQITSAAIGFQIAAPTNSVIGNINITGNTNITGNIVQTGNQTVNGNVNVSGTVSSTFRGSINVQGWKGFDIKHPNKKGHRLRHVCVEGPEAAVYVRGTLKNSNIIELPEYWKGLVDPESISITLTPIGSYQELYIKNIEWGQKVTVMNSTSGSIHCFYSIWASRIDGEPLVVEYEGEDPSSYPGSSEQFSISGYDYGRGVDNS